MSCTQLENALEQRLRIRHPEKGQILIEGFEIYGSINSGDFEQRFRFRRKSQPVSMVRVVERLDSEVVARHEQNRRARAKIADRECEHTVQASHAIRTHLFVEMNNHFRISM